MKNGASPTEPSWVYKGWPARPPGMALQDVAAEGLNIFRDDFLFPVATVSTDALEHNIETMGRFCRENDVYLAPHAKTTMSPEIIQRQIASGAWAITAATVGQARTFRHFGVERILIAHQVVDPAAVRWIARELNEQPNVEIMCLVDSLDAVEVMETALDSDGVSSTAHRPIDVLVELGVRGGRSGCRSVDEAIDVARAASSSRSLRLVGVEGYEGVITASNDNHTAVDDFLRDIATVARRSDELDLFSDVNEIVLTAGGSMLPDRAVAVLGAAEDLSRPKRLVIRSGCYVTHDSGMYATGGPFGLRSPMDDYPVLRPAMMVWAYVVSRPEPDLVILGFGKRDASYDVDLPRPLILRHQGAATPIDGELDIFALNDQHAFARIAQAGDISAGDISVGDVVGCGISHPCTTFDKWRAIPLVDDQFNVVDAIRTFF